MSLSSTRSSQWLVLSFLASVSFFGTLGCGERSGIGTGDDTPDGGGLAGLSGAAAGGGAGMGGSGAAGATGGSGAAGATGGSGAAGATGGSGAAGATPTGQAGASGGCGAVCEIYCPYGNVTDASGCPLCKCNPAPTCQPSDCSQNLPPPPKCASGTNVCARNDAGKCVWSATCATCPLLSCSTKCAYGNKVDANGCATCECNPAPTCGPKDCGPAPGVPSMMCIDGSVAGPVCGPTSAGTCGWTITKCPPVVCPAIACFRACPNGSRPDANGCPTCDCIETACGTHADYKTCSSDMQCQWLQPGCGQPALATGGCFSHTDVGCTSDASCSGGRQCLKRVVDPCYNPLSSVHCDACGLTQTVCL
jgi:hypothetical protein